MHFEILLEEYSAERAIDNLLPKMVTGDHTYRIITFQGKKDMLSKLPTRLKGYSRWIPDDHKIVILLDRDNEDCKDLKFSLERFATNAGLTTKSKTKAASRFQVLNRIAVEELEAWFFGDADAVRLAYPKISATFEKKVRHRNPDAIDGGTWEALERVFHAAGYFKTGYRKSEAAFEISRHMQPLNNRSRSFQVFWEGITACLNN